MTDTTKQLILVTWHDAKMCTGMHTTEEAMDDAMDIFKSPGYLICKDRTTLRLGAECNDSNKYRDIILIPTGSIISIQFLSATRTRKRNKHND